MYLKLLFKKGIRSYLDRKPLITLLILFLTIFYSIELKSTNYQIVEDTENNNFPLSKSESDFNYEDIYILGPGDILFLQVFDAQEFDFNYSISNDGTLSLPLIGNVKVSGLTLDQAKNKLEKLYSVELLRPELNLSIVARRPIRVSVIGEVTVPGIYTFANTSNISQDKPIKQLVPFEDLNLPLDNSLPTVIDAIKKAGGINQKANIKEVTLIRKLPGTEESYKKTTLNLLVLLSQGLQNQNPLLFDGDIIKIPKSKDDYSDHSIPTASLTSKIKTVYVIGEVPKPGPITVSSNTPLIQAIMKAGGPNKFLANKGRIELLRVNDNGSIIKKRFKLNLLAEISEDKNPLLQNNDIINVTSNSISNTSKAISIINSPLSTTINAFTLFNLLND